MKTLNYNKSKLTALKNTYIAAKVLYETIKADVENIQASILANNEFFVSEEWMESINGQKKRILRPFNCYLMNESDFQKFLDLCYEEYKKIGIDDKKGREYCPEAEAHDLYWEAEKQLILYGIDILPDGIIRKEKLREAIKNIKYKERVLDLILRLEC